MSKQVYDFGNSEQLLPQEEMLEVKKSHQHKVIGVPKEREYQEKRVALVPSAVGLLVENGHTVRIEKGAGECAKFYDREYAEYGAEIVKDAREIYQSDIIVKVAPPTLEEIDMMKERVTLISALHLRVQKVEFFKAISRKRITALSYEHIRDYNKSHPVMQSLSEIVGQSSILIAAEYLSHPEYGRGKMLGGFSGGNPSEVVIIGAGTVAEFAARAALGLGAFVKVFDNSTHKLRRLQSNLNQRLFTSIQHSEVLHQALKTADVVIGALYAPNGNSVRVVTEEMVKSMKEGSVIVDVSIDRGGCFHTSKITTHTNPVFKEYGVTHYGVPNIPSLTPHTSSYAMSNYFGPFLMEVCEAGSLNQVLLNNEGIRSGVYMFNGKIAIEYIADRFKLPFYNINLMLAAFS
jgi:alanine dehydrogenase